MSEAEVQAGLDLGALGSSLGFLLRLGQIAAFETFYNTLGPRGLTPGQLSVLWVVRRNPGVRQGTVAEALRIKPAHMAKMVRGFEEAGLLSRHMPPKDRRALELRLTPEGEAFVEAHADDFLTCIGRERAALSPAEAQDLARLLRKYAGLPPAA